MWVTQVLQNQAANRGLLLILNPREEAAGSTLGGPCIRLIEVFYPGPRGLSLGLHFYPYLAVRFCLRAVGMGLPPMSRSGQAVEL